jgi:ABC-2 type transport system permease protein
MTTTTTTARHAAGAPSLGSSRPAGLAGTLRSEFIKIRSVRSTYWTLIAMIIVTIGFGTLACFGAAQNQDQVGVNFDATQRSLVGLILGQLIIAVLGALTITSEYSTGMIRTSLTAMPRRGTLLAAKGIVFAAVTFVAGLIASFASFFIGQAILSGKHLDVTLGDPHVLRAVIGGALFLTACGLLSFGLGLVLRHTAATITTSVGLLFVVLILSGFLPQSWQNDVNRWIPFNAGSGIWRAVPAPPDQHAFAAWPGFAVLASYAAIAIIAGVILFRKRDA